MIKLMPQVLFIKYYKSKFKKTYKYVLKMNKSRSIFSIKKKINN